MISQDKVDDELRICFLYGDYNIQDRVDDELGICLLYGDYNIEEKVDDELRICFMYAGLGTVFFSVQNVPFFHVLKRER